VAIIRLQDQLVRTDHIALSSTVPLLVRTSEIHLFSDSTRCVITGTHYVRYAQEEWPAKSLVVVGGRGDQGGIHIDRVKAVIGQRSTL
jgi:hypothetical protein